MARIELDKGVHEKVVRHLSRYLKEEMGVEAGGMEIVLLVDFISEVLGPEYYNQGLADAQAVLQARVEQIGEAIAGLERNVRR